VLCNAYDIDAAPVLKQVATYRLLQKIEILLEVIEGEDLTT
jgi:hypothetical protein